MKDSFGISNSEAKQRHLQHGPNSLPQKPPRSAWFALFDQFRDALVVLLILAAVIALFVGEVIDVIAVDVRYFVDRNAKASHARIFTKIKSEFLLSSCSFNGFNEKVRVLCY